MSEKKKKIVVDEEAKQNKTELANRIAEQSKRVANTYEALENNLFRLGRWFSSIIDRVLFSRKHAKLVSLLLAALLYIMVNYNTVSSLIAKPLEYSRTIEDVPISARYNSDTFELSGLSDTVDVIVYGDATSVTNAMSSEGLVVADLEGLTEGNHEIQLKSEGFGSGVNVAIEPSNAMVTLKKKTTAQFDLSYDYIHLDQMDSIYSVGTPQFETAKVNVRASKDTLDTIAFVK
ncbi:MAG: hypothetical protein IJ875_07480, partial [Solobacterium sp.]|nr:hypothetical protein [Solobacterium sp.]